MMTFIRDIKRPIDDIRKGADKIVGTYKKLGYAMPIDFYGAINEPMPYSYYNTRWLFNDIKKATIIDHEDGTYSLDIAEPKPFPFQFATKTRP